MTSLSRRTAQGAVFPDGHRVAIGYRMLMSETVLSPWLTKQLVYLARQ